MNTSYYDVLLLLVSLVMNFQRITRKYSRFFPNVHRLLNNFRPKSDQKFNQSALSKALQAALDNDVQMPSRRELAKSFR